MATQPVATTATASGTRVLKESRDTHMEKVDVYSFVMICFELLTGARSHSRTTTCRETRRARTSTLASGRFVPVLDAQVPGRHDEAVLARRPSATPVVRHFASICRVLRYLKQFLASSRARPTRRRPLTTSTHQGAAAEGEDRRRHARQ